MRNNLFKMNPHTLWFQVANKTRPYATKIEYVFLPWLPGGYHTKCRFEGLGDL